MAIRNNIIQIICIAVLIVHIGLFNVFAQVDQKRILNGIADSASKDVAQILNIHASKYKNPVIIIDERHDSIPVQIEQAIVLNRLYQEHDMRDIALEGYLVDGKELKYNWFKVAADYDSRIMVKVAIQLLQEGEISAAEFMLLCFDDLNVHPIEDELEYDVTISGKSYKTISKYFHAIANKLYPVNDPELFEEYKRRGKEYYEVKGSEDEELIEERRKSYRNAWLKIYEKKFGDNPEVFKLFKKFYPEKSGYIKKLSELVNSLEQLSQYVKKLDVKLSEENKKSMDELIVFWTARNDASFTLAQKTFPLTKSRNTPVTLIIGAGHTQDIEDCFISLKQSYIVTSPNSILSSIGFGKEYLKRKYSQNSLYTEGISKVILESTSSDDFRKPPPVLNQSWFIAKSELYLYVSRISEDFRILCANKKQFKKAKNYGYSNNYFKGKYVYINPEKISIVREKVSVKSKEVTYQTAIFPVVLNPDKWYKKKTIWVKIDISNHNSNFDEQINIESLLFKSLKNAKEQEENFSSQLEDNDGRLNVNTDTIAVIGNSEAILNINLRKN